MNLPERTVHVWVASLDRPFEAFAALLDEGERARAARFAFERHRRRFIVAHAMLRLVLADLLEADPASLRFTTGPHGKPQLADHALRFNLSHSGERAAVAVASDREVGIDIEVVRPMSQLGSFAALVLAPAELAALARTAGSEQTRAVLSAWTRKEALVKARGDGLRENPAALDVGFGPDAAAVGGLCVRRLDVGDGYVGAVAAVGRHWEPQRRAGPTGM